MVLIRANWEGKCSFVRLEVKASVAFVKYGRQDIFKNRISLAF